VTIAAQCSSQQEQANVDALRKQGFEVVVVCESKHQATIRGGLAALSALPLPVAYARSARFTLAVEQLCTQRSFGAVRIERHHDWSIVTDQLIEVYERAIDTYSRKSFQDSRKGGN
jgi:hypothetical protein